MKEIDIGKVPVGELFSYRGKIHTKLEISLTQHAQAIGLYHSVRHAMSKNKTPKVINNFTRFNAICKGVPVDVPDGTIVHMLEKN